MTDISQEPVHSSNQTAPEKSRSYWSDVWRQFRSHKGAMLGAVVFFGILLLVIVGPLIYHVDPTYIDIRSRNQGPSLAHPFGTDQLGRDILARMMAGGQVSMAVGITAMLISLILGTAIGVLAGYFKRLDGWLMRLTDLFLALPLLPLLLVIILLFRDPLNRAFGPEGGIFILMVTAIGITSWMQAARCRNPAWNGNFTPAKYRTIHSGGTCPTGCCGGSFWRASQHCPMSIFVPAPPPQRCSPGRRRPASG